MARAEGVAERIEDLAAPDGAAVMERMTPASCRPTSPRRSTRRPPPRFLSEMDATLAASVIADMEVPEASMVLEAMDPDDRVDILEHVPAPLHDQPGQRDGRPEAAETPQPRAIPARHRRRDHDARDVTALPEDLTVEQAIDELRRLSEELEQMFYVYVVDRRRHLVGVLSMRDLILARPDRSSARS